MTTIFQLIALLSLINITTGCSEPCFDNARGLPLTCRNKDLQSKFTILDTAGEALANASVHFRSTSADYSDVRTSSDAKGVVEVAIKVKRHKGPKFEQHSFESGDLTVVLEGYDRCEVPFYVGGSHPEENLILYKTEEESVYNCSFMDRGDQEKLQQPAAGNGAQ